MHRKLKFRGVEIVSKKFIYGDLCKFIGDNGHCIMPDSFFATRDFSNEDDAGNIKVEDCLAIGGFYAVDSETIGQFTGLNDKNGTEIYEGDIVKTDFKKDGSHETIQVIEFYEGSFGSRNKDDQFRIPALFSGRAIEGMNTNYYEVIGNIHQNPELLKGADHG